MTKKVPNKNPETDKWLGSKLLKEEEEILANRPSFEDVVRRFIIAKKNWLLCIDEIEGLKEEIKRLQRDVNILKRD